MKTITVINQKGGVGKTTTSHLIGTGLHQRGYKVLMIDLDSQRNLSYLLSEDTDSQEDRNIINVFTDYKSINNNIIELEKDFYFLPGDDRTATIEFNSSKESNEILKKAIKYINKDLDYIIIDTPPTLSRITINSIVASDKVIIPSQADIFSLQGLQEFYKTYKLILENCKTKAEIDGIVITRYNKRTNVSKAISEILEDTAAALNTKVYKTKIRECTAIRESQAMRKNLFNKKSNAREDYNNLIDEIIKTDNN